MKMKVKNVKSFKWLRNMLMLTLSLGVLSACNNDDADFEPEEIAYVSLYQASPNAPDLDIMVGGRQINFYPFNYADYTGYLRFFPGNRNINFSPTNANNVVADTTLTFEANHVYSLFTVDNYDNLKVLKLEDNSETPSEGKAMVRFINLSPDAPALNLQTEAGASTPWFSDQAFMEPSEFTEVSAESHNLMVTSPDDNSISLNVPNITLQPGWYYTIIVRGYNTPPSGNNNVLSAQIIVN